MPAFKHREYLAACADQPCPGVEYQERECVGFHWVHEPRWDDDFNPPALVGVVGQPTTATSTSCGRYALSFFKTENAARRRLRRLSDRVDVANRYGTHAVKIQLLEEDGRCSLPSKTWKHFDLHEYDGDRRWPDRIESTHQLIESD